MEEAEEVEEVEEVSCFSVGDYIHPVELLLLLLLLRFGFFFSCVSLWWRRRRRRRRRWRMMDGLVKLLCSATLPSSVLLTGENHNGVTVKLRPSLSVR